MAAGRDGNRPCEKKNIPGVNTGRFRPAEREKATKATMWGRLAGMSRHIDNTYEIIRGL